MTENPKSARETLEREKARLLKEAAVKAAEAADAAAKAEAIDRDMAELDRLAAKYSFVLSTPPHAASSKSENEKAGTIGALVERYLSDSRSSYRTVGFSTRKYYDTLLKHIKDDCAQLKLTDLNTDDFQRLYDSWTAKGTKKLAMGRSLITMMRGLFGFGARVLEDRECDRLSFVLHKMKFAVPRPRKQALNLDQAEMIIAKANEKGWGSIALAQAIQWNCGIRQKDVVGEWVPIGEPGLSTVTYRRLKWLRGLRWEEINESFVLRHTSGTDEKEIMVDLKIAPMVMKQLGHKPRSAFPASGPVILRESTGRPWDANEFRKMWRTIARACDIPDDVRNADSQRALARNESRLQGAVSPLQSVDRESRS